jgi:hypothetical protein
VNPEPAKRPHSEELDRLIVSNRKLEAVRLLRERYGFEIADALKALTARYLELREASPALFTVSDAEYWDGFHS